MNGWQLTELVPIFIDRPRMIDGARDLRVGWVTRCRADALVEGPVELAAARRVGAGMV